MPCKLLGNSLHSGLSSLCHGVHGNDRQAAVLQHLLAQLFVGALHAHDQRHIQVGGLASGDDAGGNGVALHDAAKDVDQNGLDLGVFQHDLEGFRNLLGGGTAAHVQEVGGLGTKQLDGVHGRHGQASAVHQAANIAVQADVSEVKLAGFDFGRIFFVEVAVSHDLRMTVQRVGVKVEFGVQRNHIALAVAVQRVDFDQGGVGVHVALVELLENIHSLCRRASGHANGVCNLLGLRLAQTRQRIDELGDDLFGGGMRHFLDVHAAFTGGNKGHLLRGPVRHHGHVVFLLDIGTVFDVEATYLLAFRASLVGLELHSQDLASDALDIFNGLGNLDAATLATAPGVDLRLDNPYRAAEFLCGFHRLLNGERCNAARHWHTKLTQDFLALVLVNFHEL